MNSFHVRVRQKAGQTLVVAAFSILLLWPDSAPSASDGTTAPSLDAITIPAGPFITGSDANEREAAYQLDEAAYGHTRTRQWGWYDDDLDRQTLTLPAYAITRNLITQADYTRFVAATGREPPDVDRVTWNGYGLIHPYLMSGHAPVPGSTASRLPTALQWEKAARGIDGRMFP